MCAARKSTPKTKSRKGAVPARPVLLVTGLSGAGLSTALKTLEDLGYQAVDNLPLSLVPDLVREKKGAGRPLAIGIDSRTWDFSSRAMAALVRSLKGNKKIAASLLFIDCQDTELQRRFTETRRVHPLAQDRPVADGVARDRARLGSLRDAADLVIDTTDLSARDFRRMVAGHYTLSRDHGMLVFVTSFGFKHGLPRNADLVFDVRFLDNPYWKPNLRKFSGQDRAVADYIRADAGYGGFFENLTGLLSGMLPRYQQEGRYYLTIAIGCTGGRHRSVFTAEELFNWIDASGYSVAVSHRDIDKVHAETAASQQDQQRKTAS